jgi:hypothetical protein
MRTEFLWIALAGLGCNADQRPDREQVERAVEQAEKGLRNGYKQAKERLQEVDWQRTYEETAEKVEDARDKLQKSASDAPPEPEPQRWWERADEAVKCEADTCVIEGWFTRAAKRHLRRLEHDVQVFTAPENDGWLIDEIREGSLADVLGFQNGDVIQTVAGHALTEKWQRVGAIQALQMSKTVMIGYRRGNGVRTLRVVFADR